jgi:hypothetical protein
VAPAGNKLRGEVEVDLGGGTRALRLNNGDLAALNERFDRGTWALLDALQDLDHRVILATLHRALYHGAPRSKDQPSEQDLGELEWVALDISDALGRCIYRAVLGKDPEDLLSENPGLRSKVAQAVGQAGPPQATGAADGARDSSLLPSSSSDPTSSGDSPPMSSGSCNTTDDVPA